MPVVLDTDISIMIHSITLANSLFISFLTLHDVSRKIIYECEFSLLLGDVTTWKTFRNTLVFVGKIHQSLVDSRHNRPVTGTLDVFFVVNQSKP